jgi:HSP90 family molecular chaperone
MGSATAPTDIATRFKSVARILGVQLGSRKEIRLDILTSLRHLVARNLENEENKVEFTSRQIWAASEELSSKTKADKENNVLHITDTDVGMTKQDQ